VLLFGMDELAKFHALPHRILWYYGENLALAERGSAPDALLVPLRVAIDQLQELLGE
jgi:hypothetical protein